MYKDQVFVPFTPSWDAFCKKIQFDLLEDDLQEEATRFYEISCEHLHPSYSAVVTEISEYRDEGDGEASVRVLGNRYRGKVLTHLEGVQTGVAYVATCGMGMEGLDYSQFDELFVDFWKEALKVQALNAARLAGVRYFKELFSVKVLSSVNPGSGPVQLWPIEQLGPFFRSIQKEVPVDAQMVRDAYMLPNKTISGIWFSSERPYFTCSECDRENCPDRKVRFKGKG